MQETLLRYQAKVLAMFAAVLITLTAIAGGTQLVQNNETNTQQELAQQESHFWRVVAGEESGSSPGVGNLLARDLRNLNSQEILSFRGSSNRYGGITDAIGFDPFDETGLDCFECGPLDSLTITNVETARSGGVKQIIQNNQFVKSDHSIHLTPFNLGVIRYLALLYLLGGTSSLLIGHGMAKLRDNTYKGKLKEIPWERKNLDGYILKLFCPWVAYPLAIMAKNSREEFNKSVDEMFPDHMMIMRDVDRRLEHAPNSDTTEQIRQLRDDVMVELEEQTQSSTSGVDLQGLLTQLQDVQKFLKTRSEVAKELDTH